MSPDPGAHASQSLPELTLPDLQGEPQRLPVPGRPLLLFMWASW